MILPATLAPNVAAGLEERSRGTPPLPVQHARALAVRGTKANAHAGDLQAPQTGQSRRPRNRRRSPVACGCSVQRRFPRNLDENRPLPAFDHRLSSKPSYSTFLAHSLKHPRNVRHCAYLPGSLKAVARARRSGQALGPGTRSPGLKIVSARHGSL